MLVETLRQWLLQWGNRPGIAQALTVHPQTVSGRLHRLRDLLADDLEGAVVRAELLVLLTAEGVA
ncbi:helix-turn-helix domain-containing protein [Brachybacterium sp. EF45031]|uniref:helix-turn-helix domain-containing protein n=1 Tax=Brachybacterium sillae TaxID=2810536 RepID=UPI00217E05A9|nr:helix-turn-helix domain-containing protein [Brachybacterium sillae]MCS6711880.1 helix-turn-helix domain-containing protein [Brachybacterium sillae]